MARSKRGRRIELKAQAGSWTDYARHKRNAAFYVYGREFLRSVQKTGSPLVRAYLLGHALELLLKTHLVMCGIGEKALKRLRHNLPKIVARCSREEPGFLRISPELERDLRAFDLAYRSKALQYFSILHLLSPPRLPDLRRLTRFARSVETALAARLRAA